MFAFIPIHGKYPCFLKEKQTIRIYEYTNTSVAYELFLQLVFEMMSVLLLPCPVP